MLYMDIPSLETFVQLNKARAEACVSIYLPTTPVTSEIQGAKIEYANQVKEALHQAAQLIDKRRLQSLEALLYQVAEDEVFWLYQAHSLAVLAHDTQLWTFRLANHLTAQVEVGDRFLLSPLLRSITFTHQAYILLLAEKTVRLFTLAREAEPYEAHVENLPQNIDTTAGTSGDKLQDKTNERLKQYTRAIDKSVAAVVKGSDKPLITIGGERLLYAFRSVYSGHNLVAEINHAGLDHAKPFEIADLAREKLDAYYQQKLGDLHDRFEILNADGRATTDLSTAARAATYGQVAVLLVDMDQMIHGRVDETTGVVTFAEEGPDSYDILDEIAGRVLAAGGDVLAVRRQDIPHEEALAALLRYAAPA
ncbi:hypothetical protein [Bartonella sp. DGB2]|uniref:baeRF11 domain-containing protein n=1 Tax=Bartonella sp. DGB2 TaxID=3388426 RepID=UPI00398FE4E5